MTPLSSRRVQKIDHGRFCSLQPFTTVMSSDSGTKNKWRGFKGGERKETVTVVELRKDERGFVFNYKDIFLQGHSHEKCSSSHVKGTL